jgi:hypothetical protein
VVAKVLAIDPRARLAFDLRDTWQGRTLAAATGKTAAVLLSVLAHNYDDALLPLLQTVFPGFTSIAAPFFCSAGKVEKGGNITADMVNRIGRVEKKVTVYRSEIEMRDDFRRLADRLKLSDADRIQMFTALKNWVVADRRLDPAMDPKDPDAKRHVN